MTSDLTDWVPVSHGIASEQEPIWVYWDHPHVFSHDGGETYYDLSEPLQVDATPTIYRTADRPVPKFDGRDSLESAVSQALGTASVAWENMEGTGVFNDALANQAAEDLIAWINERYELKENVSA